jgi:hypothetical protein
MGTVEVADESRGVENIRHYAVVVSRYFVLNLLAQYMAMRKLETRPFCYYVLCMDDEALSLLSSLNLRYMQVVALAEFETAIHRRLRADRSLAEYCWTLKPSFLESILLNRESVQAITFLDADLLPYAAPDRLWEQLASCSVVLYPHRFPPNLAFLNEAAGKYNAGMISFGNDGDARQALTWWRERVLEWCYHRDEDGKLGDQKYLLQFPRRFSGVEESRHCGINVGPWSIGNYEVCRENGRVLLAPDEPLIFYHFHQYKLREDLSYIAASPCYPLTSDVIDNIYQPYTDKMIAALKLARSVKPNFSPIN